ncbi:MAG: ABC transporter substrate-binding protein [Bradymonadia bacterium]
MKYALCLFLSLTLTACGGGLVDRPPLPETSSLRDKTELKVGIEAFDEGRFKAARIQFERLLKENQDQAIVAHARYYMGRMLGQSDPIKGAQALEDLATELVEGQLHLAARAYGAEAAARGHQCARARAGASAVHDHVGGATRADLMLSLSKCFPPPQAMARLDDGARAAHDAKDEARVSKIRAEAVVRAAQLQPGDRPVITEMVMEGPLESVMTGSVAEPEPVESAPVEDVPVESSPTQEAPAVEDPGALLPPDSGASVGPMAPAGPPRIVVLLPLSGRSAPLGDRLRGVIDLVVDEDHPEGSPQITVKDAGSVAKTRAALSELAGSTNVSGIIAILDRATAQGSGDAFANLALPVIALTLGQAPMAHEGVWRGLHTPPLVAQAAARAGLDAGGRRAAILYPDISYGRVLTQLFRGSWQAGGGQIVKARSWSGTKPDIKSLVRALKGVEFDTLFIPAPPQSAATVLSHLAAEAGVWSKSQRRSMKGRKGVKEVTLLGVPEWYTPKIIDQAGRYVDGALLPVPYAAETAGGGTFAGQYVARHNRAPTAFEALLMDAISALSRAHDAARSTGVSVASALQGTRYAQASVGYDFSRKEAVQSLFMLEITPDGFRPLNR